MNIAKLLLVGLALCTVAAGGCTKEIKVTIGNHSDSARTIQLSTPDDTMTVGAVSAGGRLSTTLKVKESDLPAQCRISAGAGAQQSFMVDKESPAKWWFHITKDGQVVGPYGKDDVHTETEKTVDVSVPVERRTILK